ncbi:MAG: sulfatase-like hydrolase/transferase [Thermoguttaceae bacterium]
MRRATFWIAALGIGLGFCSVQADETSELRLVPFPKEVRLDPGTFDLRRPLILEVPERGGDVIASQLVEEFKRAGLPEPVVRRPPGQRLMFLLYAEPRQPLPMIGFADRSDLVRLGYVLLIRPDQIVGGEASESGVFHAAQTLRQLVRANRRGDALPCLWIADWPSLRWRCFQDDMTRGPSSKLETLKFEADLGAYLKFNLMTYYMEYQYAFKKHPKIGPADGSLTPEDLAALVAYAKPRQMDILGNQQSFGHFSHILKHPEYAHLREGADLLCPVNEETYQLLDDLYSEVCPLVPLEFFNVCCDETWELGKGPSKELAAKIGVGGVYVRHIRRIHDLLQQKYKKRMMMWGDIILQHPQHLHEIPKDTIMLTWAYDARPSFEDQIIPFAKSGFEFFVCPGVSNWNRILPDFGVAKVNIQNFVRDGIKHGALGMLNTDWKDDGEALAALKWHGDAWAAECVWNGSKTPYEAFNRRVGAVLFGEKEDHFGQAVELLAQTHRLPEMRGMNNSRFWEDDFLPKRPAEAIRDSAQRLLNLVRPALEHLEACRDEAVANHHILDAYLFGARRMELIGQRMLDGLEAARLYTLAYDGPAAKAAALLEKAEALIRKNRDAHEQLGRQFAALWLSQSRPYALDWTLRRYQAAVKRYEQLAAKVADARRAARSGKPLPRPDSLGLAIPEPSAQQSPPPPLKGPHPVLGQVGSAPAAPPATRPPNFVLFLIDDLGWMDLGCQGSTFYQTPQIDRMARQGMRFTNAYAACAVCSPTRAAVLTGRYPARVGVTDWIRARFQGGILPPPGKPLPDFVAEPGRKLACPRNPLYMELGELTLAEALKPAGYVSCHVGKWHLGPDDWYPERQGFDLNFGGCDLGQPPTYFDPYRHARGYDIPTLRPRSEGEYLTDRLADEAVAFIRAHQDRPFFLNFWHYAVHTPLQAKKELVAKYKARPKTHQQNAVYAAMIESVDDSVGKVLAVLDELGLAERTLVVFTSDNGGLLGPTTNLPLRSGKGFPYEGGIRVPMLVRWPGVVRAGSISEVPVCSIDLFPTLLEIAGVKLPADRPIDGVSLVPLLSGGGSLDREALYWHFPHYRGELGPYGVVRCGQWKLIQDYETGRVELYNLAEDLGESRDLAGQLPEKARQLERRLTAWLESVGARLPRANPDYRPGRGVGPPGKGR